MKNINSFAKIFLYLCTLSGFLWVGSYLTRLILTYQLFEKNDFILKSYLNSQNLPGIFITLNAGTILSFILYILFIASFIIFVLSSRINLKENGWLFIITTIVLITFPFELYLMTVDYKMFNLILSGPFNSADIVTLIIKRFKILGSFPVIELLCYFVIAYLIIFQPLKMNKKKIENEN
jgi:hypothetical protein